MEGSTALLRGHFRLSSGLHSEGYVQCQRLFTDPSVGRRLAQLLAPALAPLSFAAVVAPALGGILWGYELASATATTSLFVERQDGVFALRRGQQLAAGTRVVIAEDVITTGKSVQEVIDLVRKLGAEPVAVATIIDRSPPGENPFSPLPTVSLLSIQLATYDPAQCPMCTAGQAMSTPGSRFNAGVTT